MSWTTGMSWKHVVEDTLFRRHVVGTVLACRGHQGCRGSMSWKTPSFGGMSWGRDDHVVGDRDVVEACRGGHPFSGGMSWGLGCHVVWDTHKNVVDNKYVVKKFREQCLFSE